MGLDEEKLKKRLSQIEIDIDEMNAMIDENLQLNKPFVEGNINHADGSDSNNREETEENNQEDEALPEQNIDPQEDDDSETAVPEIDVDIATDSNNQMKPVDTQETDAWEDEEKKEEEIEFEKEEAEEEEKHDEAITEANEELNEGDFEDVVSETKSQPATGEALPVDGNERDTQIPDSQSQETEQPEKSLDSSSVNGENAEDIDRDESYEYEEVTVTDSEEDGEPEAESEQQQKVDATKLILPQSYTKDGNVKQDLEDDEETTDDDSYEYEEVTVTDSDEAAIGQGEEDEAEEQSSKDEEAKKSDPESNDHENNEKTPEKEATPILAKTVDNITPSDVGAPLPEDNEAPRAKDSGVDLSLKLEPEVLLAARDAKKTLPITNPFSSSSRKSVETEAESSIAPANQEPEPNSVPSPSPVLTHQGKVLEMQKRLFQQSPELQTPANFEDNNNPSRSIRSNNNSFTTREKLPKNSHFNDNNIDLNNESKIHLPKKATSSQNAKPKSDITSPVIGGKPLVDNNGTRRPTNPFRVVSISSDKNSGNNSRKSSQPNSRISSIEREAPTSSSNRSMESEEEDGDSITKIQNKYDQLVLKCTKLQKEIDYLTKMNHQGTLSIDDTKKLSKALEKLQEYLDQKMKEKYEVGVLLSRRLRREINSGGNGEFWIGRK
ncbi:Bni5p NDAI_0F03260 [Naumovozyma dairenensis CBS 421]|uniref:Uncharacterized protein n=1 Tax=Naumovozyma dairenensis (strain ATCC 10597 / BCRC 20456 / CBS 421 / NBRC 0211 / NRRL Y-12639) TaxID=1071378 RepID=G0WCY3_NAUDC|nr:hypothetical protein NDAI_0F03260 [Naumovozyma dairenensis CBS 421]CCD25644.1 hypothetical protein NDAI_0F03260 [Naumovozyma dairenensis CBS 421]